MGVPTRFLVSVLEVQSIPGQFYTDWIAPAHGKLVLVTELIRLETGGSLRLIPFTFAALLLGAHFLRSDQFLLVLVCLAFLALVLIRKRWSLHLMECLAFTGVLVWLHTTFVLVQQRIAAGMPWLRMFLILAAVTASTLVAGFLLRTSRVISSMVRDRGSTQTGPNWKRLKDR
jgi:hypothetical protein